MTTESSSSSSSSTKKAQLSFPWRVFGLAAYGLTAYTILQLVLFVSNLHSELPDDLQKYFAAASMDGHNTKETNLRAAATNLGLLMIFFVQHLVMARGAFKKVITAVVPWQLERAGYCIATCLALWTLFKNWTPLPEVLLEVPFPKAAWALHFFGWAFVGFATFCIDHFELFGVSQLFQASPPELGDFVTRGAYKLIRHPIMTGFLTAFWVYPNYTVGRLLFASANHAFVLFTVSYYEEPDLEKHIGQPYLRYKRQVPGYLPSLCPVLHSTTTTEKSS
mmetsp:Transcript_17810/g.54446  ORF Transcript_17810/g.54446 Transcript_17810/m.54446 type:complete len:278 (-) Transcript_17810:208-1041(-)